MKKIFLISCLMVLTGCGRGLNLDSPIKKSYPLNENLLAITVDTNEYSNFATTFSMFFLPEEQELHWKTNLYEDADTYETKITRIMKHVIKNSDEFDLYDQKIIELNKVKEPLTLRYNELDCDFDYVPECNDLDEKLKVIDDAATVILIQADGSQKKLDYEGYKSFLIEEIQASVDDYDRINPDRNKPRNWMLYGDAPLYEIRPLEDGTIKIVFPNLGPFNSQNAYSTETGEIFDVKFELSPYNSNVTFLKFKIHEKDSSGKFTGYIWDYSLERSFAVGKLRYKGDVLKLDPAGNVLRRGICKIDFAKKGS